FFFFFQAEDGIRDRNVTGVQTCALPISFHCCSRRRRVGLGFLAHGWIQVHADDPSRRTHLPGRDDGVESRSATQIEHGLPRLQEIGRASCRERVESSVVAGLVESTGYVT